jgi:hypothetical protein
MNRDIVFVIFDDDATVLSATTETVVVHEVLDEDGGTSITKYDSGAPIASYTADEFRAEYHKV